MAVTLLLDSLASEEGGSLSQVDACAVYTLACLGINYGLQDCRWVNLYVPDTWCSRSRPCIACNILTADTSIQSFVRCMTCNLSYVTLHLRAS